MYADNSQEAKPEIEARPIGEMLLHIGFPTDENLYDDDNAQTLASLKSAEVLSG